MIDILKRKFLYLIKNIMSQIFCVAGCCHCRHFSCDHAKPQSQHSHDHKDQPALDNVVDIPFGNANVNDLCHFHGNENLHQYLKDYK